MGYADQVRGSRRFSIIAGVAAVHGAIGYLFVSGMAVDIATKFVPTLVTTNVPIDVPPPPPEPLPPSPTPRAMPAPSAPVVPFVATEAPASSWTVAIDPGPLPLAGTGEAVAETPAVEPAPPASLASAAQVRGNRAAWFTTDDYPAAAIRGEEEGTVAVTLSIAADGRVSACTVTAPSGSAVLDQATCRLYRARGRFLPARNAAGDPVAATFTDRIRWQLPAR